MADKKLTQMKQQIASHLRKKDYYEILGLSKTCSQAQIKKAYYKLALRFHPDKNSVQGAKQVFKKVSNAYTTLSNAQKRQHYDRYGPQQHQPPPRQRAYYRNGFGARDQQFDQFDQIFRAFFGGGNVRFNHNHYQNFSFNMGGPTRNQQQRQQSGFNFGWVFLIFIAFYMLAPLFKSQPQFSMTPSAEYRFKQTTSLINAPYYVKQSFFLKIRDDPNIKKSIDQNVDLQFISKLDQACDTALKTKKSYERTAYYYGAGATREAYLRKAQQIDTAPCYRLHQIKENYPDYVRNLFYYY